MKTFSITLAVLSLPLLLNPPTIAMARPPVYKAMEAEYVPTLSVSLADDSDPQMAILDLGLSNPTENFIQLNAFYFCSKSEVDVASKDAYYSASYLNFWQTYYFASYTGAMALAPKSNHLHRRVAIRKPAAALSSSDHEPNTYLAIKNGETLLSAFSGVVSKAVTYQKDVDYPGLSAYLSSTNYYADTNQTKLSFTAYTNATELKSIDFNKRFFNFTFAGAQYQASDDYSDENDLPWVSGLHYKEEFSKIDVALYKKGDAIQDTAVNLTQAGSSDYFLSALPYIFVGGLTLFALALIAGLIVLSVWVKKKRRTKNPS